MTLHGFYALRGFDYQVTVTLDVLLQHFAPGADPSLMARPEGEDDLVLSGKQAGSPALSYLQIKKPRESGDGQPTQSSWSLSDVARDLLPGTLTRLRGNDHEQTWILGDAVDADVLNLVRAGLSSPMNETGTYLTVLHLLARNESQLPGAARPGGSQAERERAKSQLDRWRPLVTAGDTPDHAVAKVAEAFIAEALKENVPQEKCAKYRHIVFSLHSELAPALARTTVRCTYGTETAIRQRVARELAARYSLTLDVVANALIRNLRGFVQDISVQPDKWINRQEFELELRSVWPRMNLVAEPPALGSTELLRQPIVNELLSAASSGPLEVTGVSGAGKTKLASAVLAHVRATRPGVHALYVEVRPEHQVRDVLAGVAFHLRRFGVTEPFALVTEHTASDEHALRALAKGLCEHGMPTLLLLDLVQGTCSDVFARELAIFVEELRAPVSLVTFGQESALRGLSALERVARGLPPSFDVPGFDFEEFVDLVQRIHSSAPDRNDLWTVFQTATGGRSAGLYARLADAVARCSSVERMNEIVSLPRERALAEADRARYLDVPIELRDATDRVVCFALPFRREEAETIFPDARMVDGIRELLKRGLLRKHDTDLLEMHETVRAGLEQLAPLATRTEAHLKLARHYEETGNSLAVVHHLEQAGHRADAHRVARDAFLAGRQRLAFGPYAAKHRLISTEEVIAELMTEPLPEHAHVLPQLLGALHDADAAEALLAVVRTQAERFKRDYRWAWLVTDAVLASDPTRVEALIDFCLAQCSEGEHDALDHIAYGARNRSPRVSSALLATFQRQPKRVKVRLVPILLLDCRREVLGPVLSFIATYEVPDSGNARTPWRWGTVLGSPLRLQQASDFREFLGALPLPETSQTIVHKGVLFGRLEAWIWNERRALQGRCISILQSDEVDEVVLENALRVLVFLGDGRAVKLAERYAVKRSRLGNFATFLPALLPSSAEPERYRRQLLDLTRSQDQRLGDHSVLLHLGVDMSELLAELTRAEPQGAGLWQWLFVMHAVHRPWSGGVALFEKMLSEGGSEDDNALFGPLVMKFGELPGSDVTDFLVRQLQHPWLSVRAFATLALCSRRSQRALQPLLDAAASEPNATVANQMVVAAVASGPISTSAFEKLWPQCPDAGIWRLVLASRLHAETEAEYLVAIAVDPKQHWQLRRMAILAATKLPPERALVSIVPSVLVERSSFALDAHPSLETHSFMANLLRLESRALRQRFVSERARFVALVRDIVNDFGETRYGIPSGEDVANWLCDRLSFHDWTKNADASDKVVDELHVPIVQAAALRGLRLTGNYEALEEVIKSSDSVWLLSRALIELKKERNLSVEEHDRLKQLVDSNPIGASYCPQNIIKNTTPSLRPEAPEKPASAKPEKRVVTLLEVEQLLKSSDSPGNAPLVIVGLTREQFAKLVEELAPDRDYSKRWVPSQPKLGFTATGFTVQGTRLESSIGNKDAREKLRPALAAAAPAGASVPWHDQLLQGHGWGGARASEQYAAAFIRCLGAQGQPERLYDELTARGDLLFPLFDDIHRIAPIRPLVDLRAVPFLLRFVNSGTDALLESMCWLASAIDSSAVDPVLNALFVRWIHRFTLSVTGVASADNTSFWHAFGTLRRHPRFRLIENYDLRLAEQLRHEIVWFRKRDIVDALSESARAYIHHETMLFRSAPFEHFLRDEVDWLEDYAERLFGCVSD